MLGRVRFAFPEPRVPADVQAVEPVDEERAPVVVDTLGGYQEPYDWELGSWQSKGAVANAALSLFLFKVARDGSIEWLHTLALWHLGLFFWWIVYGVVYAAGYALRWAKVFLADR